MFPRTSLVRRVTALILETFDASEQEAEDYAAGLVARAEGWGSPESAAQLDWGDRIKKDLGEGKKLRWRSEDERIKFEAEQRQKYEAYEAHIRQRG